MKTARRGETHRSDLREILAEEKVSIQWTRSWKRFPGPRLRGQGRPRARAVLRAYDLGEDQLFGRWFPSKGAANVLTTFRLIRRRYPDEVCIHLIMDNLAAHWTDDIQSWAEGNNVELVPTPTYTSWLNRIEPQFGVMVKFVIAGSDYSDHGEFQRAASAWLRHRNHEARRDFEARQQEKAKRRERWAAQRRERLAREAAAPDRAA